MLVICIELDGNLGARLVQIESVAVGFRRGHIFRKMNETRSKRAKKPSLNFRRGDFMPAETATSSLDASALRPLETWQRRDVRHRFRQQYKNQSSQAQHRQQHENEHQLDVSSVAATYAPSETRNLQVSPSAVHDPTLKQPELDDAPKSPNSSEICREMFTKSENKQETKEIIGDSFDDQECGSKVAVVTVEEWESLLETIDHLQKVTRLDTFLHRRKSV